MHTKTALKLFAVTAVSLFWYGCEGEGEGEDKGSQASHIGSGSSSDSAGFTPSSTNNNAGFPFGKNLTTLRQQTVTPIAAAIDIQPANGSIFGNVQTATATVKFTGFTTAASQKVSIQVLSSPAAVVGEASWVTIATGTSAATGTSFNDPAAIFRYEIDAVPGAKNRWDQGGILRYRALVSDASGKQTLVPFWDSTSGDCIAGQGTKSWKALLEACKSPFSGDFGDALGTKTTAAALVSPTPQPGDDFDPSYLSRKGFIFPSQTDDYYDFVNAPRTLQEFQIRFGFLQQDVSATYYNLGDLGIGREMHCAQFVDAQFGPSTACYVRNYGTLADGTGDFSGDPDAAMDDALAHQNSFAAVCMVKFGNKFGDPRGNDVQFFVYNSADDIVDQAQLDSIGSNEAIPNNCTNCHGGSYDGGSGLLKGSTFLPFDPQSFLFSNADGFSYQDQEESLRQLNSMMKSAGAPPGTAQFVDGIYGGKPDTSGTKANFDWIPPGWSTSEEAKTVYREVYKPYCRTCHTSQVGDFAFITYEDFKGVASKTMNDACVISQMPVCEATLGLFWRGPARAYLVNALNSSSSCTPGGP